MKHYHQILFLLIATLFFASSGRVDEISDEKVNPNGEPSLHLEEAAAQESLFHLVKHKGGGKWELPEWVKKAAEKSAKKKPPRQYWDDFDDEF